jgi:ABC-type protease/lipase transport system fused ATPase/permease subunit
VQVLILALGACLVISGEATAGVMIASDVPLLGRALAPVELIVGSWRVLAEGRAAYRAPDETDRQRSTQPRRMTLPAPRGELQASKPVLSARGQRSEHASTASRSDHAAGEALAIIGRAVPASRRWSAS